MADVTVNRERLKSLMLKRNVGDGDMAKLTGISRTTFYYLRTGHHSTTSERALTAIAEALDTTVEYLTGEGEPEEENDRVAVVLDEPTRKLAQVAANLSAVRKEELIRMAQALVDMEREQNKLPLDAGAMDRLIAIYDQLRIFAGGDDPLDSLEELLRNNRNLPPGGTQASNGLGNHSHNH
jgi:transcriptional regulator with XRE-family HTH domain